MAKWIEVPENQSFDGIKQGQDLSDNPKDYVKYIRQKEKDEAKVDTDTSTIVLTPVKVKPNDVSEITKRKNNVQSRRTIGES